MPKETNLTASNLSNNTSKTLQEFAEFIHELEPLKEVSEHVWNTPIAPEKWTLKELVCHLWHWDKNILEVMLPDMKSGGELPAFVDIEQHNQLAREKAKTFPDGSSVLQEFTRIRKDLAEQAVALYDPAMRFTVGGGKQKYSIDSFIRIFVHHDRHHKKQIVDFLSRLEQQEPNTKAAQQATTPLVHTVDGVEKLQIVELEELHLVGVATRTTNAQEMTADAKIPKLWGEFWQAGVLERVSEQLDSEAIYGAYYDYQDGAEGEYTLLVGYSVLNFSGLSHIEGLQTVTIPAAKYAVFTTKQGPVAQVVGEAWQAIWQWMVSSEVERAFTGDFELYDERSIDPQNAQLDIYIAIK